MRCSLSSCPQWDLEPRASFFCATLLVSESTLIYLLFLREVLLSRIWEFTAGFWSWLQPKDIQSLGLQSKHRWTVVSFVSSVEPGHVPVCALTLSPSRHPFPPFPFYCLPFPFKFSFLFSWLCFNLPVPLPTPQVFGKVGGGVHIHFMIWCFSSTIMVHIVFLSWRYSCRQNKSKSKKQGWLIKKIFSGFIWVEAKE